MPFTPDNQINNRTASGFIPDKKTMEGFAGNVLGSSGRLIGDTLGAAINIFNPDMEKNTVANILKLGSGVIQLAIPGEQGNEKLAKAVGQFYVNRYGGIDNAWNTLYNDPAGMVADLSVVLGGAGALLKGGAGLATSGSKVTSLASNAAKVGKIGSKLARAGEMIDPILIASKGTGAILGGTRSKLASSLTSESENILTRGMGNPKTLEKAKGVSPVTMNELFSKYNLYDRSPESFQAGFKQANTKARGLLESAPTSIETRNIVKLFDDEIAKLAGKAKTSTKNKLAMDELINRKQMFLDGIQNADVSTPLMNDATKVYDIKSSFQGDLPPSSFGQPTADIGKNLGVKKAYQTLLGGIEQKAPGIRDLGREQSALLKLKDMATSQESRGAAKQNINIHRMGGAFAGGAIAGIPGAVGGYITERFLNSPQFLGGSSKALQLGARGMDTRVPIPNIVRQGASAGYNFAKVGRMSNVNQNETYSDKALPPPQPLPVKNVPYKPSISQQKNVFKNKAPFGSSFKLKSMN